MSILRSPSIPSYRNPELRPGLAALVVFLKARGYPPRAIGRILDYTAVAGTPTGSEYLVGADEAGAEAAFVDALPEIPYSAGCWDRPDAYIDAESLIEVVDRRWLPQGGSLVPSVPDEEPVLDVGPGLAPITESVDLALVGLAPIAGGAPLPSEPWEDWPRSKDAADRRRDMEEVAGFYRLKTGT